MTRARPQAGCLDLAFDAAYAVDEAGEVALEDYARALARAGDAEVLREAGEGSAIAGLHLCALGAPVTPAVRADIEGFARSLTVDARGGLGWS